MAYTAFITRIKNLRQHPNADRLQMGECFGNIVIVSMDYEDNQLGIYFPSDGQVSTEFAEVNNLLRKKDDAGNNIGGYMDPEKRNITAIKLRGEKSDGLFLPLKSLETFGDIATLKEGDRIDNFNGHEICCKYVPRRNVRHGQVSSGNKTRKKKVNIAPLFTEHADTEQLAYNLGAFKPGDEIEITLKMHGCFVSGTRVRMGDNTTKQIQQIKKGDYVLGYNFDTKRFEPTKVLKTFRNSPSNVWNKVKFTRNYIRGDDRGHIVSTPNHPYWWDEQECWIEAQDLVPGMKISCLFPSYILTQQQKEILVGHFLGDGCLISFESVTAEMQNSAEKSKEHYIDYLVDIMNGYYYKCNQEYKSGYGSTMVRGKTYRSADLYKYFNNICTFNNQKGDKLKNNIVDEFTELSMAIFYMDDGSLVHNEHQEDRALFAICDYSDSDANIIANCFRKFNIEPTVYKDTEGYNRIRLNTIEAHKMFDLIAKYIPPVMRYKLPKKYRNLDCTIPVDSEVLTQSYVLVSQEVSENIQVQEMHIEYDLETELHNYVVGLSIVHNTSQRTAHLPVFKGYKKTIWDRLFRRDGTPIYGWGYVSGTRRTVLENFEGGYYGSNEFREQHSKFFEGKLWKGEEVYYEVVGFTHTGTPIMSTADNKKLNDKEFVKQYGKNTTFSYGCEPYSHTFTGYNDSDPGYQDQPVEVTIPQSDIYVYRMTMTNEDGDMVEYTPDFMRYRCEQMGVKTVPVFAKATIDGEGIHVYSPDGELYGFVHQGDVGETVKEVAEKYYDGPDPIGKTHVREGVVVRIVNRPKFCAYKHKNWSFKALEGIVKVEAEAPDMEEADSINEEVVTDEFSQ